MAAGSPQRPTTRPAIVLPLSATSSESQHLTWSNETRHYVAQMVVTRSDRGNLDQLLRMSSMTSTDPLVVSTLRICNSCAC